MSHSVTIFTLHLNLNSFTNKKIKSVPLTNALKVAMPEDLKHRVMI